MVDLFQRLPGARRTPAGFERTVLRHLPRALWLGTLLLALPSLLVRALGGGWGDTDSDTLTMSVDVYVAALVFLHWNLLLTVAIGAFIVMVMKGPAYVADAYPFERTDPPVGPTP